MKAGYTNVSTKIICDRCDEIIPPDDEGALALGGFSVDKRVETPIELGDLCGECVSNLKKWMESNE